MDHEVVKRAIQLFMRLATGTPPSSPRTLNLEKDAYLTRSMRWGLVHTTMKSKIISEDLNQLKPQRYNAKAELQIPQSAQAHHLGVGSAITITFTLQEASSSKAHLRLRDQMRTTTESYRR